MPNIFGASLLDLMSQGGQFIAGRQQQQRQNTIEDEKRKQQGALQEALMAQYQAQAEANQALAEDRRTRVPAIADEQYEGAVARAYDPNKPIGDNVQATVAAFPQGDPNAIAAWVQRRADALAQQAQPKAPIAGTPEGEAWFRTQERIRHEFDPPAAGGVGGSVTGSGGGLPKGMPVGAQAAVISAVGVDDALNRFEGAAKAWMSRNPMERAASQIGMPLGEQGDTELGNLESLRNELRLTLKEMANLGVLNGPDMGILDEMIGDPTSWGAVIRDPAYILTRVNRVRDYVRAKKQAYKQAYGVDADALNSSNVGEVFDPQTQIDFLINAGLSDEEIKEELARRGIQ